jgi:hypothetical protein
MHSIRRLRSRLSLNRAPIIWGLYGNKFFHLQRAECHLLREGKVLDFDSRHHRLSTYIQYTHCYLVVNLNHPKLLVTPQQSKMWTGARSATGYIILLPIDSSPWIVLLRQEKSSVSHVQPAPQFSLSIRTCSKSRDIATRLWHGGVIVGNNLVHSPNTCGQAKPVSKFQLFFLCLGYKAYYSIYIYLQSYP